MKTTKLIRCWHHRAMLGLLPAAFAQAAMPPSEALEKLFSILGSAR